MRGCCSTAFEPRLHRLGKMLISCFKAIALGRGEHGRTAESKINKDTMPSSCPWPVLPGQWKVSVAAYGERLARRPPAGLLIPKSGGGEASHRWRGGWRPRGLHAHTRLFHEPEALMN